MIPGIATLYCAIALGSTRDPKSIKSSRTLDAPRLLFCLQPANNIV